MGEYAWPLRRGSRVRQGALGNCQTMLYDGASKHRRAQKTDLLAAPPTLILPSLRQLRAFAIRLCAAKVSGGSRELLLPCCPDDGTQSVDDAGLTLVGMKLPLTFLLKGERSWASYLCQLKVVVAPVHGQQDGCEPIRLSVVRSNGRDSKPDRPGKADHHECVEQHCVGVGPALSQGPLSGEWWTRAHSSLHR